MILLLTFLLCIDILYEYAAWRGFKSVFFDTAEASE